VTGLWFSPGTPVFSTNKTDRHDISEILLKVGLNTKTLTPYNRKQLDGNNEQHINCVEILFKIRHLDFPFTNQDNKNLFHKTLTVS
jgi:hypothetical protein